MCWPWFHNLKREHLDELFGETIKFLQVRYTIASPPKEKDLPVTHKGRFII